MRTSLTSLVRASIWIGSALLLATSCFSQVNDVLEVGSPPRPGTDLMLMFSGCAAGNGTITVDVGGIAVVGNHFRSSSLGRIVQLEGLDQDGEPMQVAWSQVDAREGLQFILTPPEGEALSGFTLTDPTVLVRDRMIIRAATARRLASAGAVSSPSGVVGFEVTRVDVRDDEVALAIRATLGWEDLEVVGPDGLSLRVGNRPPTSPTDLVRVPSLGQGVVVAQFPVRDVREPARLSIEGLAVTFFGSFDVPIPYCL